MKANKFISLMLTIILSSIAIIPLSHITFKRVEQADVPTAYKTSDSSYAGIVQLGNHNFFIGVLSSIMKYVKLSADEINQQVSVVRSPRSHKIEFENIIQYPELPTGCEITSLTMLLNHIGFNTDKVTMAENYLPKLDFYYENEQLFGADFRYTFAGTPESEESYGCYAPCITTTANAFLSDNGSSKKAYDLTGTSLDDLFKEYTDNDQPVLIWVTSHELHESRLTTIWTTPDGLQLQWRAFEHCVVLTGYDLSSDVVYVSDPMVGNTSYSLSLLRQRYNELGTQAVCIN